MVDYWQLVLLGAIAGFTIFLGLPIAAIKNVSANKKGFLNALALGILVFLIIDVFSHAWESTESAAKGAFSGSVPMSDAVLSLIAMFGGVAIGLVGLVIYETRMHRNAVPQILSIDNIKNGDDHLRQLFHEANAYRLAMMIAIGIGAHNFSEGLAIGQSYVAGEVGLAILLIIGFGAHNATEGFGIAGPLTGLANRPKIKFLLLVGLIGGGPTFLGTILGSMWVSNLAFILFLSIAGGALIYVSLLMYNSGRRYTGNMIMMLGILIGLCAGFMSDLIVSLGGA
ncbi:MAG: ZIP family metal transporter [Thaumarchaeota archaeon]|nr:ZIP family metal transporter [Nitrososphaerota archaeon]